MTTQAPPPAYRRYWNYTNRPFTGCGCAYGIIIALLIFLLLFLFFPGCGLFTQPGAERDPAPTTMTIDDGSAGYPGEAAVTPKLRQADLVVKRGH